MGLTPQGRLQVQRSVEATLARLDRRLQKLLLDLESIQAEVNDLRNIRATLASMIELLEQGHLS